MEDTLTVMANLSTKGFEKGTKEMTRAIKSLSRTAKSFGRTMITTIAGVGSVIGILTKSISTYMSQNEQLSQRMNAIWTALGNVLGPIIEQIVEWISTAVSYFLSFLQLLGVTGKSASELSKSAKKNTQELQRTLLGFDELNVLQDNNTQQDKSNPLRDIEPSEFMKKISDLLKAGMFEEVGREIARKLNEMVAKIPWGEIGAKLRYYFMGLLDLLYGFIDEFDWKALGAGIRDFLVNLFSNPQEIAEKIMRLIKAAWDAVLDFIWGLFWGDTEEEPPLIAAFRKLGDKIYELAQDILPILEKAYNDWIKPTIDWLVNEALPKVIDFLSGLVEKIDAWIKEHPEEAVELLKGAVELLIGLKVASWFKDLMDGAKNAVKPVMDLVAALSGGGGAAGGAAAGGAGAAGGGGLAGAAAALGTGAAVGGVATLGVGLAMLAAKFGSIPLEAYEAERATKYFEQSLAETDGTAQGMAEMMNTLAERASHYNDFLYDTTGYTMEYGYSMQASADSAYAYMEMLTLLAEQLGLTTDELLAQIDAAGGDVTKIEALGTAMATSAQAMGENRQAIADTNEEYKKTSGEITQNAQEMADGLNAATKEIKTQTEANTAAANEAATQNAEQMNVNVSGEYSELEGEAAAHAENILTKTDATFQQVAGNASTWGSDMVLNFVYGIQAQMPALEAQLIAIANMINAYVHFTKPDKGPLSDFDEYGPDMIKEFIGGIESQKGRLEQAMSDIAETVSFRMPSVASGSFLPYSLASGGGGAGSSDVMAMIAQILQAIDGLEDAISSMQLVAQFGSFRVIAEAVDKELRRKARSEGK